MRKAFLTFPDISSLIVFLLRFAIKQAEVDTTDKTISGLIDEDAIVIACTEYDALLNNSKLIDY